MTTPQLPDLQAFWRAQGWPLADASVTTALPHLGVIVAQGADAATFLHGQLSQDVLHLGAQEARLAAYCSAKGRMLASFLLLHPSPETYWLVVNKDVLPAVLKRLSMFVLRAKVKLGDGGGALQLSGQLTLTAGSSPATEAQRIPVTVSASAVEGQAPSVSCALPMVQGVQRTLVISPAADTVSEAALSAWRWLEVMAGVPQIEPATTEQFVPQMVNFELIGGVNFKKGCYPGQEVVARSQYRGTTKRRAFVLLTTGDAMPGAELFSSADPGQPAGMVVNAAPMPGQDNARAVLAELKLQAVDALGSGASLHLGAANGAPLTLGPLPYEIPRGGEDAA